MIKRNLISILVGVALSCFVSTLMAMPPSGHAIAFTDVQWGALNPARGEKSPRAGSLWGDRTSAGASGFLVKFVDGFVSPPHIHNVTYRGVVINGLVHNDDPQAKNMWLPGGSFWTQPSGGEHITAAKGAETLCYIEIDSGPYLVRAPSEAFDEGEHPINVHESNLVWLDASEVSWIEQAKGLEVAFLWSKKDDDKLSGRFIKFPSGFSGQINHQGFELRAVVISGQAHYQDKPLKAGSYFGGEEPMRYDVLFSEETILYVRADDALSIEAHS